MRLHTLNINDNLTFVNEKKDQWENSFIVKCLQMWFILWLNGYLEMKDNDEREWISSQRRHNECTN